MMFLHQNLTCQDSWDSWVTTGWYVKANGQSPNNVSKDKYHLSRQKSKYSTCLHEMAVTSTFMSGQWWLLSSHHKEDQ